MFRPLSTFIALAMLAGTAHAQEREWVLDTSDEDAYLIFGVPDSDDVGVSLWCPIGRGVVNLFVPRPTEELRKLKRHIECGGRDPRQSRADEGHSQGRPLQRAGGRGRGGLPALRCGPCGPVRPLRKALISRPTPPEAVPPCAAPNDPERR